MRTLDQRRMTVAHNAFLPLSAADRKLWEGLVNGLGAEVQRCGLLQALAFLHRRSSERERELVGTLCTLIAQHLKQMRHLTDEQSRGPLLTTVRDLPVDAYMRVTREVIELSVWLKRSAQIGVG